MKMIPRLLALVSVIGLAVLVPVASGASTAPMKKVLFFSKSSGYEHSVVKRINGNPSFAENVLKEFGAQHNIEFVFSKDGSLFTADYLAQFDAFLFYTTGDLTLARNNERYGDDQPPMTAAGKAALLKAIENGKGFVGLHCAADTFHSPGNKDDNVPARYISDGDRADPYIKMIGGEFIKHDAQQPARQIIVDAKFPGMSAVPANFGPNEEWYSLKNFPADLHVLLAHDTSLMKGASYERASYPSTWARMQGKGRVFYSSLGHREDVWNSPAFQAILLGGLDWSLRRVDADVTPNFAQVTPQANVLPKFPEPAPAQPKKSTP